MRIKKLITLTFAIFLGCTPTKEIGNISYEDTELTPIENNSKWGYVDDSGCIYIEPKYDSVGFFYNGIAKVKLNKSYGLIKKDKSYLIKPKYEYVDEFHYNYSRVTKRNRSFYIDSQGEKISKPPLQGGYCGSVTIIQHGKLIKVDDHYELLIERSKRTGSSYVTVSDTTNLRADTIIDYSQRYIQVRKNGKIGITKADYLYIDDISITPAQLKYDSIVTTSYHDGAVGYAKVKAENLWGIINDQGYETVKPIYLTIITNPAELGSLSLINGKSINKNHGKLLVEYEEGRTGYINLYGKEYFKR